MHSGLPLEVILEILAHLDAVVEAENQHQHQQESSFPLFSSICGTGNAVDQTGGIWKSNPPSSVYRSLALVCRTWFEPATSRLYRNIAISGPHQAKLLARTLKARDHKQRFDSEVHLPHLGDLIQQLSICDPQSSLASFEHQYDYTNFAYKKQPLSRDAVPSSVATAILEQTSNLEHLALRGKFVKKIDTSILSDRPLRSLSLDVDSDGRRVDNDTLQYLPTSLEYLAVHCLAIPSDACVHLPNLRSLDMTIPARHLEHTAAVFSSCIRLEKLTIRRMRQDDGVTELLESLGNQLKVLEVIDPELECEIATDCILHTQNLESLTVVGGSHRRWVCVVPRTLSQFNWHVDGIEDNLADFLTMLVNPGFLPQLKYIPSISPVMLEDNFGMWKIDARRDALAALRLRGLSHPGGDAIPENSLWKGI